MEGGACGAIRALHGLLCAIALASGISLAVPARAEPQCLDDAAVCLEAVSQGAFVSFVASNRSAAPYTMRVAVKQLSNLKARGATPFRAVLEPGEERVVGALSPIDPRKATRYEFDWRAAHGSILARPDASWHYRMPFGGTQARVLSQGVGGRFSHRGAGKYAFDFSMPWGTPVLAARAGRVILVRDGNLASGAKRAFYDKANAVEVLHADGTIATYSHLRHGAVARVGQTVATGDVIGLSGDTGFSTGPHLHFMVWRRKADLDWETIPVRFHDGSPQGFLPAGGVAYAPACSTAGRGCAEDEVLPRSETFPAARAATPTSRAVRRDDGSCACPNGAVIHVDLPCDRVCGG